MGCGVGVFLWVVVCAEFGKIWDKCRMAEESGPLGVQREGARTPQGLHAARFRGKGPRAWWRATGSVRRRVTWLGKGMHGVTEQAGYKRG